MRHGRAVMPFGKHRGVRIRLLPDDYVSWLSTASLLKDPSWAWLKESLIAELKFRGLRADLADTVEPEIAEPAKPRLPRRAYRLNEL